MQKNIRKYIEENELSVEEAYEYTESLIPYLKAPYTIHEAFWWDETEESFDFWVIIAHKWVSNYLHEKA